MKLQIFAMLLFATIIIGCGASTSLNTETKLFDRPSTFFIRPSAEVQALNKMTGPRYVFPERDFRGEIVSINLRLPNLWWEMNEQFPILILEGKKINVWNQSSDYFTAHLRMPFKSVDDMSEELLRREIFNDMKREAKRLLIEFLYSFDRMSDTKK